MYQAIHHQLASGSRWVLMLALAIFLTACGSSDGDAPEEDTTDDTVDTVEEVSDDVEDEDTNNVFDDSDGDGLSDFIEDANGNGMVDEGETDPNNPDTDNDGLPDGLEDANQNGFFDPGETDPTDDDTDDDTLLDGIEDANLNGIYEPDDGETDPLSADSDGDGIEDPVEIDSDLGLDPNDPDSDDDNLPDGIEDLNKNGIYEAELGETDPISPDTDDDGLSDGCEDTNANAVVDDGETDPRIPDSDSDGLIDGDECMQLPAGACPNFDNAGNCRTNPTLADTDGDGLSDLTEVNSDYGGGISSDPRKADTDGDGVPDGLEDFNQNGRFDPALGELNPIDPETDGSTPDGQRPQAQACLSDELPDTLTSPGADLKFAFNSAMTAVELDFGTPDVAGWALDHDTMPVSAFVISKTPAPTATNALEQERIDAGTVGGESSFPRSFTTWDGFDARISNYELGAGGGGAIDERNALVAGLTGISESSISGLPSGPGMMSSSGWQVSVLTVYRDSSQVILVGAYFPLDAMDSEEVRAVSLTNGTGLAKANDDFAYTESGDPLKACNIFRVNELPIVDFLFIIDDTASMGPYQNELDQATSEIFSAIRSSFISARWTVASTEIAEIPTDNYDGYDSHCGLTSSPVGPDGNVWAPFTVDYEDDFDCKIRDPLGIQNCDPSGSDFPGFEEYGLLCSKWAIDYLQGRRGTFNASDLQRPRSELIVIIVTDECEAVETGCTSQSEFDSIGSAETLNFLGVNSWSQVTSQVAANAFIDFYKNVASAPPYGSATPFLIYDSQSSRDQAVYYDFLDADPTVFPNGASMYIEDNTQIPEFVQQIIRAANGLASEFQPSSVPITANMRCVVQRAFSTDSLTLSHSLENGWNYDPVGNSMVFFGADRPQLLDSFAINYAYWVEPGE